MKLSPERYRGEGAGILATPATQEAAKKVLSSWRCVCAGTCGCFPLQKLVERAAQGKVLFYDQVKILEQLLEREGQ